MSNYFRNSTKRKSIELTSNETVKQAVVAGLGYSIIPLIGMRNELRNKDIYIIPANGKITTAVIPDHRRVNHIGSLGKHPNHR